MNLPPLRQFTRRPAGMIRRILNRRTAAYAAELGEAALNACSYHGRAMSARLGMVLPYACAGATLADLPAELRGEGGHRPVERRRSGPRRLVGIAGNLRQAWRRARISRANPGNGGCAGMAGAQADRRRRGIVVNTGKSSRGPRCADWAFLQRSGSMAQAPFGRARQEETHATRTSQYQSTGSSTHTANAATRMGTFS